MIDRIVALGQLGLAIVASFGRSGQFLFGVLAGVPRPSTGFPLLVKQLYSVGVLSLAIVIVSGLFIGMVLGLQGYTILSDYGSEAAIGQMIALTLVRELGPVVTALLFAGRAGSAGRIDPIGFSRRPRPPAPRRARPRARPHRHIR